MSTEQAQRPAPAAGILGTGVRVMGQVGRFARRKPLGAAGAGVLLLLVIAAVFSPFIETHNPIAMNIPARLQGPSMEHFFGTDQFGRDVFSRIIQGSQVSLIVGFGAAAITIVLACMLGLVSGYFRGMVDASIQRFVDALMALPTMVVLLMAVFLLGKSLLNVTLVLGVIAAPAASRVVRGATLTVMTLQYVDAARAMGGSHWHVVTRHVLPNITAPLLVLASVYAGANILAEAALSFLGLGLEPPTPTWGNMLSLDGLQALSQNPWLAVFPGVFITLTVFGINMLGDALRDELDPSRRGLAE